MLKRREFLLAMAGTASLGALASTGRGVFNPSQAAETECLTFATGDVAGKGIDSIGEVATATKALNSQVASASAATITALTSDIEKASNNRIAYWSKPGNKARFVSSAAADEAKKAARALKVRYSNESIQKAVKKALANLRKNNISAIETDPIIGPVVKAGYVAVSQKMRRAAQLQREIDALRKSLHGKLATRAEAEVFKLKQASKISNKDFEALAKLFPSLAPSIKKAINININPVPGGINVQPVPGGTIPQDFEIPVTPKLLNQQVKPNAIRFDELSRANGNVISGASTPNQNIFDSYAQIFESRLSARATPIDGESDPTPVDILLGIEKANACELVCAGVIVGIVVVTAIVSVVAISSAAEAYKNEACKELILKQEQAEQVAACEARAEARRAKRLADEKKAYKQCLKDYGIFGFLCAAGNALEKNNIEGDYDRDKDACS